LFNSFHLKAHHVTDATTRINRILSLECQNIEPNAPKTPKTPWKTRTGTNTVIAKTAISIAIQSTTLMSNFTAQPQDGNAVNTVHADNAHNAESSAKYYPSDEELLLEILACPLLLDCLCETPDERLRMQETLRQWQQAGCPDLKSLREQMSHDASQQSQ
jgi:hypothetical protein